MQKGRVLEGTHMFLEWKARGQEKREAITLAEKRRPRET